MNSSAIILTILLIVYFINKNKDDDENFILKYIILGCTLLSLEAGLRHLCVGPDTPTYYTFFETTMSYSFNEVISNFYVGAEDFRDPAYNLIVKLFTMVLPSWQLFLIAVSALFFFSLGRLMYKYIESLTGCLFAFSLYLGLFHVIALSGIRQCIATSIMFLVIPEITEKRWKIAVPVILMGSTIHISLLFSLAFVPFMYIAPKVQQKLQWISILLFPVVLFSTRQIVGYMVSFLANDYYAGYAQKQQDDSAMTYIILCLVLAIYIALKADVLIKNNAPAIFQPAAIMMTLAVPLIALDGSMIRIGQYYTLFMMMSFPFVIDRGSMRSTIYWAMCGFLAYHVFTGSYSYHFFWENVAGFYY